MVYRLLFFYILLSAQWSAHATGETNNSCLAQARAYYAPIHAMLGEPHRFQSVTANIRSIQELHNQRCFDPEQLTLSPYDSSSETYHYFNLQTMEPTPLLQRVIAETWQLRQRQMDLAAMTMQPAEYEALFSRHQAIYREGPPQGISAPVHRDTISASQMAQTCAPVTPSIRDRLPPVRSQNGSGWCFFFTASDLLSFKIHQPISAAYLGSIISPDGMGGAGATEVNDVINDLGLCSEQTMPSNNLPWRDGSFGNWIDEFESKVATYVRTGNSSSCERLMGELNGILPNANMNDLLAVARAATRGLGVRETITYHRQYEDGTRDSFSPQGTYLAHLALNQCRRDRQGIKTSVHLQEINTQGDPVTGFEAVNRLLDRGEPAGVSYDINELTGTNNGDHVSSVVDRRVSNGRCQFLVRNSYGTSSCTRVVQETDACSPPGYFWVNALDLMTTTNRVIFAQ